MGCCIGILTFVLVVDCLALILLVLIQLPKKEAGAGLAFGGAATDALFGAGSGNVLTKVTKYSAGIFFVLALLLSVLQSNFHSRSIKAFKEAIEKTGPAPSAAVTSPAASAPAAAAVAGSNAATVTPPAESATMPAAPVKPAAASGTNK